LLGQHSQNPAQSGFVEIGIDFEHEAAVEMEVKSNRTGPQGQRRADRHLDQGQCRFNRTDLLLLAHPVGQGVVGKIMPPAVFAARKAARSQGLEVGLPESASGLRAGLHWGVHGGDLLVGSSWPEYDTLCCSEKDGVD